MKIENILRLTDVVSRHNFCFHDMFGIGTLGAAGISAAANITSTSMNNKTQRDIAADLNQTNMNIADKNNATAIGIHREDNAFNAAEAQKNRDFEERMSDPAFQRQRLVDAGYNPLMMGDFSQSVSGSTASSAPAPSLDSPDLVAPQTKPLDFSGFADIVQKYFAVKDAQAGVNYVEQKAEGQRLENLKSVFEVNHLDDRWYNEQELHQWQEDEFNAKMFNYYFLGKRYQSEEAKNWAEKYYKDALKKQVDTFIDKEKQNIAFANKMNDKLLVQADEQIKNLRAQRSQIYAQAKEAVSQARLNDAQSDLLEIDQKYRDSLDEAEVNKKVNEVMTMQIRNCSAILNSDLSDDEKDLVATFLANHPDISVSDFFACMKDVESAPNKDWSRKWKMELWEVAKDVLIGGAAAAIVVASGGTAAAAATAAIGGIGASKMFASPNSVPSSSSVPPVSP